MRLDRGAIALALAMGSLLALVVASAWVCDDAYITFRVVDNLLHGHGLRWNPDERVEVYTHPLWMGLHVPLLAVTGDPFLSTLALGIVCTAAAVALAWRTHPGRPGISALVLVAPLACSRSFVEFATSGLENPLSFLLFAVFGWLLIRRPGAPPGLALGGVVGLAWLNRLDLLFFYAPPLLWLGWRERRRIRWGGLALGLSPLALWQVFRWLYYGFPFPNPKYAKLDTGAPLAEHVRRGLVYALDLALADPPSVVLLAGALALALWTALRWRRSTEPERVRAAVVAGSLGYAAYVVAIGGDWMSGRFWSLPVFAAAWCLHGAAVSCRARWPAPLLAGAVAVALLLRPSEEARAEVSRLTRVKGPEAVMSVRGDPSSHPLALHGLRLRAGLRPSDVLVHGAVGILGYYAGPEVIIVDELGLTDPLLARLPPSTRKRRWRVGHVKRTLPRGYLHARATGSTERMEPGLAEYYERLRLVTDGPLLDPERLRTIVGFQLGSYDALKQAARGR